MAYVKGTLLHAHDFVAIRWLLLPFTHQFPLKIICVSLKLFEFSSLSGCSLMSFGLKLSASLLYIPSILLI